MGACGNTILHAAVKLNLARAVTFFSIYHRAALLDAVNEDAETPLHMAAQDGNASICQALVKAGALTTKKNGFNETPEDLARRGNHRNVMLLLGSCGRISATRVGGGDAFAVAIRDA